MIRDATRHQHDVRDARHTYMKLCIAILDAVTSHREVDKGPMAQLAALVPHCEHTVAWVQNSLGELPEPDNWELFATKLSLVVAQFAEQAGSHQQAGVVYRRVLAKRTRILGSDHPETLTIRRSLVWMRWNHEGNRDSIDEFEDFATACARSLGPADPMTLAALHDFAWVRAQFGADETILDDYREIVRMRQLLVGRPDLESIMAQLSVVSAVWARSRAECEKELLTLLDMVESAEKAREDAVEEQDCPTVERVNDELDLGQLWVTTMGWLDTVRARPA
ncbi:hypothetical protein [Umezawaea sp. NPDC059074]|uniref:hypothetical protein n=1 Tax=Umezawaea sp. NPDC059074 TaxID=3346716 RepID=UPI00367DD6C9